MATQYFAARSDHGMCYPQGINGTNKWDSLECTVKALEPVIRPFFKCRHCGEPMKHIAFHFMKPT
ncbi:hypothetical protein [Endozoicomonas sp.]|uniref:hypothetical protein n=1 Tax=Endozoicomonas sp. TaxID=1892382 RepID=UPI00383B9B96